MFTITAIEKLRERGFEVELLCYPGSRLEAEASKKNITLHTCKAKSYFHPSEILALVRLLKKNNYSLVHTQASKDLWVLTPALKLAGSSIPLFLTKQVGSFIVKKDFLHKFLYRRITKVFAISEVIRKNLLETCPVVSEQIELLHNAVDTSKFNPARLNRNEIRNELNIKENTIAIGMLARFSPGKGHEEFLTSAKILNSRHNNLLFVVIGEASRGEDEYATSIRRMAEEAGLTNILFTGYRSDTDRILYALDIFAFPSHAEAFGIALVEAMAMERPCVGSASDGVLDIIVDGESGLLFKKADAVQLAEKLEVLITSPELRNRIGKTARKRAIDCFDIEVMTDKVINFYKTALQKK